MIVVGFGNGWGLDVGGSLGEEVVDVIAGYRPGTREDLAPTHPERQC